MKKTEMNAVVMRGFLWSGVLLVITLIVAQGFIMGFIPPPSPAISAEELKQIFMDRKTNILFGSLIQCFFWSFWFTWATPIVLFIRKMEGMPALTYASIASIGGGYVFFLFIPMTWAVMAFRGETVDPSVLQIMNDWVWFDWLFTWPPFSIWMAIIAIAILYDHNVPTIYPRWVAFFNLWCALLLFPAGLIGFFKTGPFAYDGLISFWFAVAVFFSWMIVMTVVTFSAVKKEEIRLKQDNN